MNSVALSFDEVSINFDVPEDTHETYRIPSTYKFEELPWAYKVEKLGGVLPQDTRTP